ncbi:hypothetical protein QBC35DRAFT_126840 [Podospora australis]|uniref:Uncharacterized protein n=1 Tax=Podospora australis TaxID=1536484 RepID=A0AAN6WWW9_9PEZI|nr:hypothetical protein QBC35DRAFT_126840 [Podospora australis]
MAKGNLPDFLAQALDDHILNPDSYFRGLLNAIFTFASAIWDLWYPLLEPVIEGITAWLRDSPNIVASGSIIVFGILVWRILSFFQRLVAWGTRMVFKLTLMAIIAALASMAYQRGIDKTADDVMNVAGKLYAGLLVAAEFWIGQYNTYSQQQKQAQLRQQRMSGSAYGGASYQEKYGQRNYA